MAFFLSDLHLHTVLSACAETEMLPELIVKQAKQLGLRLIAVTDHNSAENAAAVVTAAKGTGITVLPGMEVQTREEVHLLCLFDSLDQVRLWQDAVYAHLPPVKNDERLFGIQVVLDSEGNVVGRNDRMLLIATSFSVEEVVRKVSDLSGVCIPAHVDRPAYSIIANLGFVPRELGIAGVEISPLFGPVEARTVFPELERYSLVGGGDAHRLREMARRTTLKLDKATVAELSLALAGEGDRGVWVDGIESARRLDTMD